MKPSPFLIQSDSSGTTLSPIHPHESQFNEAWLQELLRKHPHILPVAEIEPIYSPLIPICREVGTTNGSIDNLFISHRGYLVLVETKLWRNPEAKREVVAQTMDYASALTKWSYDDLDAAARQYTASYEGRELALVDWVEDQLGPVEGGAAYFEETVIKNLRLGRFLSLIVGDRVRRSVVDMLAYVNKYPHMATDVALVELRCFQWDQGSDWPLLVVPGIVAKTEIVERSIVQVTVKQEGDHEVEVQQEKAPEGASSRKRVKLTEEAFWELMKNLAPDAYAPVRQAIDHYRDDEAIIIEPMAASLAVRLQLQPGGQQVQLFFVHKGGTMEWWPGMIRDQLRKAGLDDSMVLPYEERVRRLMRMGPTRKELACLAQELNLDEFLAAVDAFVASLRAAEPTE